MSYLCSSNWYTPSPAPFSPMPQMQSTAPWCLPQSSTMNACASHAIIPQYFTNLSQNNTNDGFGGVENMFSSIFNASSNGEFRLSVNGKIAVKTTNGYKTYDVNKKCLTNCDDFVFDVGDECFFSVPATKIKPGDIILINNIPKCVMEVTNKIITVLNYENSTVENIVPERHMFLGKIYFFTKIVSMFGNNSSKNPLKKITSWMLMSKMCKNSWNGNNFMSGLMVAQLLNGKDFSSMFDGAFDDTFDFDEDDENNEEEGE